LTTLRGAISRGPAAADPAPRPARPYLVVAGETATGKSEIALAVAERLGGEIVIADSRQIYRGLDIGTARPTLEDRARVRHHLFDRVEVGERYTAGDFAHEARAAIVDIESRGRMAIACGGTGFYLAALAGSLDPMPALSEEARGRLFSIPPAERHAALIEVDPETGRRVHPSDAQRVERALGFWLETGEPLTAWQRGGEAPLPHVAVRIVRPRAEIRARVERRLDAMLAAGLVEEARRFREAGHTPEDPGLDGIGYREWWPYFEGAIDLAEARRRILVATLRYAKRQATWFRHQGAYRPVPAEAGAEGVIAVWRAEAERAGERGR